MRQCHAQDEMRGDKEGDEKGGIRKRRRGDDVLPGDVDGGESGRRQEADDEEVGELAVTERQGTPSAS
jgi:hypothetical protein